MLVYGFFLVTLSLNANAINEQERKVGREIVATYLGAAPLIDDTKKLQYVNTLGQHLVQFTPQPYRNAVWLFGVINTKSINAFAAPGGYILITQGLFDLVETEDQLAFILAHEISHVVKQHHLAVIQKQSKMKQVIAKMQNNVTKNNDMFSDLSDVYKDFAIKGLDKTAEYEADLDGTVLATKAGFNSYAGYELLYILSDFHANGKSSELFFKTHPHPLTRIDELTNKITEALDKYAINSKPSSAFKRLRP
jgi:predicted Zn-dependent protease